MKISVVVPAYNEALNISQLTDRLRYVLDRTCDAFDIIYIYEGNDDGVRLLEEMSKKLVFIKYKYSPVPLGIGGALKEGFGMIPEDATHILTMDADLSHDPGEIPKLIQASRAADIVIGSRYVAQGKFDQMPQMQKIISQAANGVISNAFNVNVRDLSSGFRLYNRDAIIDIKDKVDSNDYGFFPESLIIASRMGYSINEVPITYYKRMNGKSKLNLIKTGLAYGRLILSRNSRKVC